MPRQIKKGEKDLESVLEDCVANYKILSNEDHYILQVPLPPGIELKEIIVQINKKGMAMILWKLKGSGKSITTKKVLPFLPQGDCDRDGIQGKAEKDFLYVTRPKLKPSATPDMVESLRHDAPIPRPNREGGVVDHPQQTTGRSNTISVAATKTEEGFGASAYYDDLATKLWTNHREILNVVLGLAVIGISMYVITGKHI
ncbi:unnamed protein product [Cuscuta epithymum]|uniref:Uncharacterized protein n=1 Tax=Cuscuta epithymum TaxID=186058 RepID=A0AAV0E913_9ASTE|nr:unnamed protein product [Cuscuta epithymum]